MRKKHTGRGVLAWMLSAALAASLCVPALGAGGGSLSNFTKRATYDGRFTDVKESAYYYEGVKLCYETGILNGTSATTFSPDADLTQAQLTLIAARMYNIYHGGTGEIPRVETGLSFELSKEGNASRYLKEQLNIPSTATTYATPYNEEAARWTLGLFGMILEDEALTPINHLTAVPDVQPVPNYCKELEAELLQLYNAGILTGSDEWGTLYGNKPITRGAVATIVARILEPSQRKVLNLKEGRAPIVGVLDISSTQLTKTNAFLDQYENREDSYVDRSMAGVIKFSTEKDGGAGITLSIRRGNGWEIEGLSFGAGSESQYEVVYALIDDVVEESSRQQIKDLLQERNAILSDGYDPEVGITQAAKDWQEENSGTTVRIGNVNFNWGYFGAFHRITISAAAD